MIIQHIRKHVFRLAVSTFLLCLFIAHTSGFISLDVINRLERWTYDLRLKANIEPQKNEQIVIVDIDEKSLKAVGQWPWSHNQLVHLTDHLFNHYGATLVGMDVVFAEPDRSSGLEILEQLNQSLESTEQQKVLKKLRKTMDYDEQFAAAISRHPLVLGYYFSNGTTHTSGELPPPEFTDQQLKGLQNNFVTMTGYGANLAKFQKNATAAGHFNTYIDPDGISRRVPAVIKFIYQHVSPPKRGGYAE